MSQEFYVLKCFSCETFQVHIVKKAKKWECKMCGVKQSLKRNYGKGSSRDCRNQVMKLNELRLSKCSYLNQMENELPEEVQTDKSVGLPACEPKTQKPSVSKWAEYVEENLLDSNSETDENAENLLEFVKKKKRAKEMTEFHYGKNKKICRESSRTETLFKGFEEAVKTSPEQNNKKTLALNEVADDEDYINPENESNLGKYTEYLQNDEGDNYLTNKTNGKCGIFESSLTDLDDILKF